MDRKIHPRIAAGNGKAACRRDSRCRQNPADGTGLTAGPGARSFITVELAEPADEGKRTGQEDGIRWNGAGRQASLSAGTASLKVRESVEQRLDGRGGDQPGQALRRARVGSGAPSKVRMFADRQQRIAVRRGVALAQEYPVEGEELLHSGCAPLPP